MTGLFDPEAFEQMPGQMSMEQDTELRRAPSPGFWEMWIGGRFCGTYYSVDRARQAARSCYADACRRKYVGTGQ